MTLLRGTGPRVFEAQRQPCVLALLAAALCLLAGGAASAQGLGLCDLDGGVLETPQIVTVAVPPGCTIIFKAWGGGGGNPGGQNIFGGGGGYAAASRTLSERTVFTLAVGGGGGRDCQTSHGGTSVDGFQGGAGGGVAPTSTSCAGGGGGGASVVWAGPRGGTPLLVAAGGGGSGGAGATPQSGNPGGVGPFGAQTVGGTGFEGPDGGGGGGGGAGYPGGGQGGRDYGARGGGGQNFAPGDGITAIGFGALPGNSGDPARPRGAGSGGTGSANPAEPGAIVYTIGGPGLSETPDSGAPLIVSSPVATGECGRPWRYDDDGRVDVQSADAVTFVVEQQPGLPLPAHLSIDPSTGEVHWQPTTRDRGLQRFAVVARSTSGQAIQPIEVNVLCDNGLAVGCGCQASGGTHRTIAEQGGLRWAGTGVFAVLIYRRVRGQRRRARETAC
jgi:hypothetical protein